MKERKIKILGTDWYGKQTRSTATVYLKEDVDRLVNNLKFVDEIPVSSKLFIMDDNIPIRNLNKVGFTKVSNIKDCDYVVVRKSNVESLVGSGYSEELYECDKGYWTDDSSHKRIISGGRIIEVYIKDSWRNPDAPRNLSLLGEKPLYDPINLSFGKEDITEEMGIRLHRMMNSKEKDMSILALRLLLNIDIKRNAHKIACIMDSVPTFRNKDGRFFIDNLREFYPDFASKGLGFWVQLQEEYPDCKIVQEGFNTFLQKTYTGERSVDKNKRYKIVKI